MRFFKMILSFALFLAFCLSVGCTPPPAEPIPTLPPDGSGFSPLSPAEISEEAMERLIEVKLLDLHPDSRPGDKLESVEHIAVHYVANPMSTADQNRRYFNSHPNASAHFIIGLDGEILQCIPLDEVAWSLGATRTPPRGNRTSIAIECCHPDETGKFTEATYRSLLRLTSWLCNRFGLEREAVRRHSDFYMPNPPKKCPLYFVDHPDEWALFCDRLLIQ